MALSAKERDFVASARAEGYSDAEITKYLLKGRGGDTSGAIAAVSAPPPAEHPGFLGSLVQGAKNTMGLGFGDEIGAGLQRGFDVIRGAGDTTPTYDQRLEALRAPLAAARAEHPIATGLGGGLGAVPYMLMGMGAAGAAGGGAGAAAPALAEAPSLASGAAQAIVGGGSLAPAGLAARMATGALAGYGQGAIQGAGDSDAPDLAGRVAGAERGGNVGAAIGAGLPLAGAAVGKVANAVAEGAPARVAARVRDEIATGAGQKATGKIQAKADEVDALVADNPQIEKVAKNPKKLQALAEQGVEKDGQKLGQLLDETDKRRGHGVRIGDVLSNLTDAWAAASSTPEGQPIARALERKQEDIIKAWGNDPDAYVPSRAIRATGSALQKEGFGAAVTAEETSNRTAAQEASKAVLNTLTKHVTGLDYPEARGSADADVAAYFKLNDQLTAWHRIEGAAKVRAAGKEGQGNRLTKLMHGATDAGAFAMSAGMHSPVPFIAEQALTRGVPMAARAADRALARIVRARAAGAVPDRLVQQALDAGVRREVIQQLVGEPQGATP